MHIFITMEFQKFQKLSYVFFLRDVIYIYWWWLIIFSSWWRSSLSRFRLSAWCCRSSGMLTGQFCVQILNPLWSRGSPLQTSSREKKRGACSTQNKHLSWIDYNAFHLNELYDQHSSAQGLRRETPSERDWWVCETDSEGKYLADQLQRAPLFNAALRNICAPYVARAEEQAECRAPYSSSHLA